MPRLLSRWMRWPVVLVILLSCVGCDQVTKHIARQQLDGQPPRSYLGDTFRLVYAENQGAFLGLGGQLPPNARWVLLVLMNSLLTLSIAVVLAWQPKLSIYRALAGSLLLAGAVGNLIDRVFNNGLVIDFLNLGIGPLRTGIFNVADVAISLGAVLLIVSGLTGKDADASNSAPGPVNPR